MGVETGQSGPGRTRGLAQALAPIGPAFDSPRIPDSAELRKGYPARASVKFWLIYMM